MGLEEAFVRLISNRATYEEAQKVEVGKSLELFKKISRDKRQHSIFRSFDIVVLKRNRRLASLDADDISYRRTLRFCGSLIICR